MNALLTSVKKNYHVFRDKAELCISLLWQDYACILSLVVVLEFSL